MITCTSCGKQNQDHYKFCLGCGAELPRDGEAPAPAAAIEDEGPSMGTGAGVNCSACGSANPPQNRFCASCGGKLGGGAPAPSPGGGGGGGGGASGVILTALSPDGQEAGTFTLPKGTTTVGRDTDPVFSTDAYLSPRHATYSIRGPKVFVRDEGSLNGVFRKLIPDQRCSLQDGQIFRIGQELIRYEPLNGTGIDKDGVEPMGAPVEGFVGRIAMVLGRDTTGTAFPIPETGLNLGRERGEVLFADDGYVSGLHCRLSFEGGQIYLTDLGSSNGTFVRILEEQELHNGDILLMGQQLFRVTM